MWQFWKKDQQTKMSVQDIAKKQLEENRAVFESLKQYDEGKKDISTTHVREHLRDLQTTS
jgi:hypothetical protein